MYKRAHVIGALTAFDIGCRWKPQVFNNFKKADDKPRLKATCIRFTAFNPPPHLRKLRFRKNVMSSGFVSGGTADQPLERDDEWRKAQQEIEDRRRLKEEESRHGGEKSLYEILQNNKGDYQQLFLGLLLV